MKSYRRKNSKPKSVRKYRKSMSKKSHLKKSKGRKTSAKRRSRKKSVQRGGNLSDRIRNVINDLRAKLNVNSSQDSSNSAPATAPFVQNGGRQFPPYMGCEAPPMTDFRNIHFGGYHTNKLSKSRK